MSAPDVSGLSQPGQAAPSPAPAAGGHARLLAMVQGLAVGVGAFAQSAATGGREGGPAAVQAFEQKKQQMALNEQQNQRANGENKRLQQESDLRMKTMNANLLMNEAAFHHAVQMYPTEEKTAALKLQNEAATAVTTAAGAGYDLSDPADAAVWRQTLDNAVKVQFAPDQPAQEVMSSINDAASKNGKSITDYVPVTTYNDDKHGTGGTVTLVPAASMDQVKATPRMISTGLAQIKGTLDTATAALGADDPDVKALKGKLDGLQSTLDAGGKPSAGDFFKIRSSMIGPLSTRIGAATQREKIEQQKADTLKAQRAAEAEIPANKVALSGQIAAADAKARQPYQVALKQMEAPIAAGVASDKEAREKVDTYAKGYVEKLQAANELVSSLDQAEAGNAAASRAAIFKMAGMALPAGGKRGFSEAVGSLEKQGNIPQQWVSKLKDAITGDRWTGEMSQNMRDFAKAQLEVAAETLRSNVKIMNVNHGTKVDPEALINAAGGIKTESAPAGSLAEKWGRALTKSVSPEAVK